MFWKCNVFVEMLNGFLQRIAESEVLGFNDAQSRTRLLAHRLYSAMCPPSVVSESNAPCVRAKVLNDSNAVQLFSSFSFALNVHCDWFVI